MELKEIYQQNKKEQTALGQFNVYNYEMIKGAIRAGKENNTPVLIGVSPSAVELIGIEEISSMVNFYKKRNEGSFFINLDHGRDKKIIKKAIDLGFDGVHFDGSQLGFKENISIAQELVSYSKGKDVVIEGEIELIGAEIMTDPKKAKEFVAKTKIDSLAVNIGNKHGISKSGINPSLDLERLENIASILPGIYLVLHGGSGTPKADLKEAIKKGIVKVNFATELKNTYVDTLKKVVENNFGSKVLYNTHKETFKAIQEKVEEKFNLLS